MGLFFNLVFCNCNYFVLVQHGFSPSESNVHVSSFQDSITSVMFVQRINASLHAWPCTPGPVAYNATWTSENSLIEESKKVSHDDYDGARKSHSNLLDVMRSLSSRLQFWNTEGQTKTSVTTVVYTAINNINIAFKLIYGHQAFYNSALNYNIYQTLARGIDQSE